MGPRVAVGLVFDASALIDIVDAELNVTPMITQTMLIKIVQIDRRPR